MPPRKIFQASCLGLSTIWMSPLLGQASFRNISYRSASEHVKVVLSGLGGDEVAGGYVRYYAALWDSAWRDAVHNKNSAERPGLASLSKNLHQLAGCEGLLQPFLQVGSSNQMLIGTSG